MTSCIPNASVVVIGNGFDIDCGLPTQYRDFLEFVSLVRALLCISESKRIDAVTAWCKGRPGCAALEPLIVSALCMGNHDELDVWSTLIKDNCWLHYFDKAQVRDGWVDFEAEISLLVQMIEESMQRGPLAPRSPADYVSFADDQIAQRDKLHGLLYNAMGGKATELTENGCRITRYPCTYRDLRDRLWEDLVRVVKGLEKYLHDFVERLVPVPSKGIRRLCKELVTSRRCCVLSFNYTHTFQKVIEMLYPGESRRFSYCYPHGEAGDGSQSNNMVLGIDEYRSSDEASRDLLFVRFRKYYQRIVNRNDMSYMLWAKGSGFIRSRVFRWCASAKQALGPRLYTYGHSLAITDKDILERFITAEGMRSTFFHHSDASFADHVENLVLMISYEELVRRVSAQPPLVRFESQG
jgi:hypothetical protein